MVGCHFTKEEVVKLQKGLRFRFLESQNLNRESFFLKLFVFGSPEFGRGDGGGVFGQFTINQAMRAVSLLFHVSCELLSCPRVTCFRFLSLIVLLVEWMDH